MTAAPALAVPVRRPVTPGPLPDDLRDALISIAAATQNAWDHAGPDAPTRGAVHAVVVNTPTAAVSVLHRTARLVRDTFPKWDRGSALTVQLDAALEDLSCAVQGLERTADGLHHPDCDHGTGDTAVCGCLTRAVGRVDDEAAALLALVASLNGRSWDDLVRDLTAGGAR